MATIDEDGFIKITDRLSRFQQDRREMVRISRWRECPWKRSARPIPLSRDLGRRREKGERLVVLHTVEIDAEAVCESLARKGSLICGSRKKTASFVLKLSGSRDGKTDLKAVKALAQELTGGAHA